MSQWHPLQTLCHIGCNRLSKIVSIYIDSRKADSHSVHNSDPTRTRTNICLPLPQPVVTPPTPSGHSPSHWLRYFPTTPPSGINTPHVPSLVILHPPAHEDGADRGFRNVGYQNQDAGELPKRKHITYLTRRKLKIKNSVYKLEHCFRFGSDIHLKLG